MPEENYPSIFNDVIGPVMRGPSSSHCAASVRIGRIARDLMDADIRYVMVEFDKNGSLATTHKSQGSDMGLCAGLLGWDAKDERMLDSERYIQESGIGIDYKITDIGFNHPNTYKLILRNSKRELVLIAVSTGGGSIEIIKIDEFEVSFRGDIFTTLLFSKQNIDNIISYIQTKINIDKLILHNTDNNYLLEIRTLKSPNKEQLRDITNNCPGIEVKSLNPVFPVITKSDLKVPFITSDEMLKFRDPEEFKLWEYAVKYESIRGSMSEKKVMEEMGEIVNILDQAVDIGIKGTSFSDRILGFQSGKYKTSLENKMLSGGESFNTIILYVTALMEVKSSMGIIVAAPTAGSCGGLPGAVLAVADVMGLGKEEKTKALLAAGIVGVFISARSTFAAETCGQPRRMRDFSRRWVRSGCFLLVVMAGRRNLQPFAPRP